MRPGTRYLALSVSQITESDSLKDIAAFCYQNTDEWISVLDRETGVIIHPNNPMETKTILSADFLKEMIDEEA